MAGKLKIFAGHSDEDLDFIAENMRQADILEVQAIAPDVPLRESLQAACDASAQTYTMRTAEGEPASVFGIVPPQCLVGAHVPWFLGTDEIRRRSRSFLELSRPFVNALVNRYGCLTNYVDARNRVAIRWLSWCGFAIMDPKPVGANGEMFHEFTLRRG